MHNLSFNCLLVVAICCMLNALCYKLGYIRYECHLYTMQVLRVGVHHPYLCLKMNDSSPMFGEPTWTFRHLHQILPKLGDVRLLSKLFESQFLIDKKYGSALLHTNTGDYGGTHIHHTFIYCITHKFTIWKIPSTHSETC